MSDGKKALETTAFPATIVKITKAFAGRSVAAHPRGANSPMLLPEFGASHVDTYFLHFAIFATLNILCSS